MAITATAAALAVETKARLENPSIFMDMEKELAWCVAKAMARAKRKDLMVNLLLLYDDSFASDASEDVTTRPDVRTREKDLFDVPAHKADEHVITRHHRTIRRISDRRNLNLH